MAPGEPADDVNMVQCSTDDGIREGDTVILDVNGEKQAFLTVKKAGCVGGYCLLVPGIVAMFMYAFHVLAIHVVLVCSKVKVGKQLCSLAPVIGQPYGSIYQISAETSELVRTKRYLKQVPPLIAAALPDLQLLKVLLLASIVMPGAAFTAAVKHTFGKCNAGREPVSGAL